MNERKNRKHECMKTKEKRMCQSQVENDESQKQMNMNDMSVISQYSW